MHELDNEMDELENTRNDLGPVTAEPEDTMDQQMDKVLSDNMMVESVDLKTKVSQLSRNRFNI